MPKFLNGVDILANLIVDSDAAVGATIVDIQGSLTGDLFSVSDISGVPILNVNSSGAITLDGYIPDNNKLNLGNSNDLQIYHDGSNSVIHDNGTGHLNVRADNLQLMNAAGNQYYMNAISSGSVSIFHNASKKLETAAGGVVVTGELEATTLDINGAADISGILSAGQINMDGALNATSTGQFHSTLYIRSSIQTMNKAANAFLNFAARDTTGSETVMNLSNIGTLTAAGEIEGGSLDINGNATFDTNVNSGGFSTQTNSNAGSSAYVSRKWKNDESTFAEIWRNSSARSQTGGAVRSFNIYNSHDTNIWSGGTRALHLDTSQNATFAGSVTSGTTVLTGDQTLPTDFVSAASGGTFAGKIVIEGDDITTTANTTAEPVLRLIRDITDSNFPNRKSSAVDFMVSRQQAVANNFPYTRLDFRLSGGSNDSSTPSLDVMSLLHDGNVGIGIVNPTSTLHLSKAGGAIVKIGTSQNTSEIEAREVGSSNSLVFSSNNSVDHLIIDGSGNSTFAGDINVGANYIDNVDILSLGATTGNATFAGRVDIPSVNNTYNFKVFGGDTDSWFGVYDDANNSANIILTRSNGGEVFKIIGHTQAATFAGTINSGAITSTGKITGTELEGTSLDINGAADISGALTGVDAITMNGALSGTTTIVASGKIQGAELEGTSLDINGSGDISGNLAIAGLFTAAGGINETIGSIYLRNYNLGTGGAGGSFLLGKIETSSSSDGAISATCHFAYDYGTSTNNCTLHFNFSQRSGTARGTWWYEGDDQDGANDRVHARLIDDGSGNMYVWLTCVDYAQVYVEARNRFAQSIPNTGTLTAATLTTGTTLFDTADDPTAEMHVGNTFVHGELEATSLDINGNADISGNLVIAGTVDGVDISGLPTSFAPVNAQANVAPTTDQVKTALSANLGTVTFGDSDDQINFSGNVTITGVTTMTGGTVVNTTTNTAIKDTTIVLNTGIGDSAPNAADIGLIFDRGNLGNTFMGWDESEDEFIFAKTDTEGSADVSAAINSGGIAIANEAAYLAVKAGSFEAVGNILVGGTVDGVDILARDSVLSSTTTTAGAALPKAGGIMTGVITMNQDNAFPINITGANSSYTAIAIKNTGTGNAGIYYDAINGDIAGGDYGFVGQDDDGYMSYYIGSNSPQAWHYFNAQVKVAGEVEATSLDINGNANISGYLGVGTDVGTYRLTIGSVGGLDSSMRIGTYEVVKNTRQYIGYTRHDTGLFETGSSGNSPSTVLAGVAGLRICNTEGTLASGKSDQSLQLLTHIYNGNSRVALHANHDGKIGIGITAPVSTLHVYENSTGTGTGSGITVENDGTGDAIVQYLLTGAKRWVTGIDNSDSDNFKIASSADLGSDTEFVLDSSGNGSFAGSVTATSLDINGAADISGTLTVATIAATDYGLASADIPNNAANTSGSAGSVAWANITGRPYVVNASTTSASTTTTIANVVHATYTAAFFDFVIKNGTNVRAGIVYACHDGTNVEFAETSTVDLGDTSDVTLAVDISGTNMRLRATTTSSTWTIKSLIRAI